MSLSETKRSKDLKDEIFKNLVLFAIGGIIYFSLEVLYKTLISGSPLHWTMFVLGGLCFIAIGGLNNYLPWEMSVIKQQFAGTGVIVLLEFVFGCILNLWLKLGIWDYSHLPLNILGQVCLPFAVMWFFLSLAAIFLDDWLRWKLFGEEKPHYYSRRPAQ